MKLNISPELIYVKLKPSHIAGIEHEYILRESET